MERKNSSREMNFLTLKGAFAFFIGGIFSGLILLYSEPPLGFIIEGLVGGLIFWSFIKSRYHLFKVVLAATLANVLSLFSAAFIGLLYYDAYGIPSIISGIVMGLIFGAILGRTRGALIFAATGALLFFIGDLALGTINVWNGPLNRFVTNTFGENTWFVGIVALTGLYRGAAIGLGMKIYERKQQI